MCMRTQIYALFTTLGPPGTQGPWDSSHGARRGADCTTASTTPIQPPSSPLLRFSVCNRTWQMYPSDDGSFPWHRAMVPSFTLSVGRPHGVVCTDDVSSPFERTGGPAASPPPGGGLGSTCVNSVALYGSFRCPCSARATRCGPLQGRCQLVGAPPAGCVRVASFVTERYLWSSRPLTGHFPSALFVLFAACAHVQ